MKSKWSVFSVLAILTFLTLNAGRIKSSPTENVSVEAPRSSGVVIVRGMALPYLTEGSGIPCVVAGYSSFYPGLFSAELKKHIQFIFVDWKNSFLADDPFPQAAKITMETLVDDLDEVRRQLGHEKIAVLGHSWPGMLPLAYGIKYPGRASHLITIGCPPYLNKASSEAGVEHWVRDASPERKAAHRRNLEAWPDSLLDRLAPSERMAMRYVRDRAKVWMDPTYDCFWFWLGKRLSMDFEHQYYDVLTVDYDPTPRFGQITTPVFVANGRYDYEVAPQLWEAVKDKLPNLTYNLFEKSGHYPMLEEQELFDRKLIDWLQGVKR